MLPLRQQLRRMLEQLHIIPLDLAQMPEQHFGKVVAVLETQKPRELYKLFWIGRQRMGLLISHHLQAMLDATQEEIRFRQLIARLPIDPSVSGQGRQCRDRLAPAKLGMPAAGDELLGLGKEFDLPDPAAAEFDVVALDGNLTVAAISMNLLLHRV